MFSVMKMGTCLRPAWTPMVSPTIWGMMVDARDHVRMTVLWPERWIISTLFSSLGSTKGPFFVELDKLFLLPPAHDVLIALLAAPRPVAEGRLAPGGLGPGHTDGRLALAAAVGVVARVHGGAPHLGPSPLPADPTRLPHLDNAVLDVAYLADGTDAV